MGRVLDFRSRRSAPTDCNLRDAPAPLTPDAVAGLLDLFAGPPPKGGRDG